MAHSVKKRTSGKSGKTRKNWLKRMKIIKNNNLIFKKLSHLS